MRICSVITILFLSFLVGCNCPNDAGTDCEKDIALTEVPAPALTAAKAAVPGITLCEAEVEVEAGITTYAVEGTADGQEYEIEVAPDGKVIEVEKDDEEDDDDDDDDDDDK
jgi:hypothetical protein